METPALRRVREAKEAVELWQDELEQATIAAFLAGHTHREIGRARGVTSQRITQILGKKLKLKR